MTESTRERLHREYHERALRGYKALPLSARIEQMVTAHRDHRSGTRGRSPVDRRLISCSGHHDPLTGAYCQRHEMTYGQWRSHLQERIQAVLDMKGGA